MLFLSQVNGLPINLDTKGVCKERFMRTPKQCAKFHPLGEDLEGDLGDRREMH